MKNFKKSIFVLLAITAIITSCKKDKIDNPKSTDTELVHFYSADANTKDAMVLTVLDSLRSSVLIAYAAFGDDELHSDINSFVFGSVGGDYFGNLILDESKRPKLFYVTAKSGTKDNVILSFSYPVNDTVVYSLYYYNWELQEDSLLQQQRINIDDFGSTFTYGNRLADVAYWERTSEELKTIKQNIEKVFNNSIVIKDISDTRFTTQNLTDFLEGNKKKKNARIATSTILLEHLMNIERAEAYARIQEALSKPIKPSDLKKVYPKESKSIIDYIYAMFNAGSPTKDKVPNPVGTPENPDGEMGTVTIYGAHSCHYLDTACFNDDASSLSVRTYTVNIYKHINGELELVKSSIIIKSHFWDNFNSNECNGINGITLSFPQGEYSWIASRGEYSLGGGFSIKDGLCTTTVIWF